MTHYSIRLDDACPFMDTLKWQRVEEILDKYNIKPLVGIIPNNKDSKTMVEKENSLFWDKALGWQEKGWSIALHGYDHVYKTKEGGINALWKRSEFAGLPLEEQKTKIREGMRIFSEKGLKPSCFFAPSHTFDEATITALIESSSIRVISDTFASRPYRYNDLMVIVPCQMGRFRSIPVPGYWTACYHPNEMEDRDFWELESFVHQNFRKFISFSEMDLSNVKSKSLYDKTLSVLYNLSRKLRT